MAQEFTHGKGQEVAATQQLLDRLPDVPGSVLTFDALHANHQTMEKVVIDKHADFIIQVKDNASALQECLERALNTDPDQIGTAATLDYGHGRIEVRSVQIVPISPTDTDWPHTYLACRVNRDRQLLRRGETIAHSEEQSLYVASFPVTAYTPAQILQFIREHWTIENRLHHCKDRSMDEDRCRASEKGIGRVMSCIRSLVALVAGRTRESLSVIQRRFSNKTHLALALFSSHSLGEWECVRKPYKLA